VIPFKQLIRPGQSGRDVKAVKRALHEQGSREPMDLKSKRAGKSFVRALKEYQHNHGLHADGVYGKSTHAKLAPHFTRYERWLYRTARRRRIPHPTPNYGAAAAAAKLLAYHRQGRYHDDNGQQIYQLERAAKGLPVWSAAGRWVHIDRRPLNALVYLIEKGHSVGTFAICSDHHYDGPHGHAGGLAVDVSSIDGISVASSMARGVTLTGANLLHAAPGELRPWQLICGGYGNRRDMTISMLTIPSAGFYGPSTMAEHCNHIHYGVR